MKYRIGIDSGGTHIVASSFNEQGQLLKQVTAGPGNIFLDQTGTIRRLLQVINELTAALGKADCTRILIGIAGLETSGNVHEVTGELQQQLQFKVELVSDAQLALINGLHGQDGTLVIAGTGSIVYGTCQGQSYRFGDWGNLLDDAGSAYKIAAAATQIALRQYDQGKETTLGSLLLQLTKTATMPALVKKYYQLSREEIAAFAKEIAILAGSDHLAEQVITQQAAALATEVVGLLERYPQPMPKQLALSGSVLTNNQQFRATLLRQVKQTYPQVQAHIVTDNNSCGVLY